MSATDPKKTYRNLKNKGFTDSETKSPDHKYLEFHYDNKLILFSSFYPINNIIIEFGNR